MQYHSPTFQATHFEKLYLFNTKNVRVCKVISTQGLDHQPHHYLT